MKKILRFGSVLLLAVICGKSYSQGGNTCAAASGSPITIPFSANGSTCGSATDDYDDFYGTAGTCINTDYGTYFTSGPDWIYYFCATQSGPMTISLTNLSGSSCADPTVPFAAPSVAVWTGCPSSGNCVSGGFNNGDQASYGTTPEMGVAFTAVAGQCYYVSIDADAYYCDCFNYHINIDYDPVTGTIQPACTNMGFDDGTFNGWQGTYGYSVGPGPTGASTPNYVPIHNGFAQQHTITTGGVDPICGFPQVCPGFGPNSMMLGDGSTPGYGGATLEQTFQVTASNAYLNYRYAVVIQDAGHPTEQQPFFKIEVFDCSGNPIQCGQYLVVGGPGIPGFQSAGSSIYYKTWTPVFIDLTPYIGTCATVRFTVGDCSQGGHFAYVYLDADCDPMAIIGPTDVCPGSSTTLTAPGGAAAYNWTNPSGQTGQSVTVSPTTSPSTYSCTVTSVAGPTCTTTLTYTVNLYPVTTATVNATAICAGSSTTLTPTVTPTGGTYTWTPSGTGQNATVTPATTTTFTLNYTDPNGCIGTDTALVTVNPIPTVAVPSNASYCVGATVPAGTFTLNPTSSTVSWTNNNPGIGLAATGTTTTVPSFTATTAGTAVITVTPTGPSPTNCVGTPVSYTITINPPPNVSANSPTVCAGSQTTLNGTGAISYTWSGGVTNGTAFTPPATGPYTVIGTDANGCKDTATVTVTVNPLPTITVTSDSICPGEIATLTASGATSYTWSSGATSTGGSGSTATASPSSTTTYVVTGTTNGCSSTATATVTMGGIIPVTVNSPTICVGSVASLTATSSASSYTWQSGITSSGTNTATVSPASTTVYSVTAGAGGCSGTTNFTVTVNPLPVVTVNSPSVCATTTATLTASGASTYTWSAGITSTSANTGTVVPASTNTYVVTGTDGNSCVSTATATVTVNPLPVSSAGNDVVICSGTPATIGAANNPAYTYAWTPAAGLSSSTVSNPSITTVNSGTTAIVTHYTVTTTDASSGCNSLDDVIVTVNYNPVLVITNPQAVCAPTTVDITNPNVTSLSSGVSTASYSYWQNAAYTIPLSNSTTISTSGTYYIKVVTAEGCSDTSSVNVVVNPLPVSNAGTDLEFCTGGSGMIGTTADPNNTYSWSPATGLNSPTVSDPTVTLTNNGSSPVVTIYTVTTTSNQGCISQDNVHVTVHSNPTANAGSAQVVCSGGAFTLTGAVGGSATGGVWSSSTGGTFSPTSSALNAVYNPSATDYTAGTVTLTLTSTDPAGVCPSSSSQVIMQFYPLPVVAFSTSDSSGCPVHCTDFIDNTTVSGGDSIQSWVWIYGDGASGTTQNPSHCFNNSGFYDVTLIATSNHGCSDTLVKPKYIDVFNVPNADFIVDPTDASIFDSEVTLHNASSSDVISWTYSFGDGDSISPSIPSPVHVYPNQEPMTYTASLFVVNADGCTDYVEHPVVINPEFTFYIPNAFSPNDDGINDFFFGTGIGIVDYDIYIFDRWGNMIFHGNGIDTSAWNGHANGGRDVAQQDVYIWKVKLSDIFGKRHEYHGHVTLVR